jgi:hypothetical protein
LSHPYYHACSSAKRFGGVPEDYLPLHTWFDESKRSFGDHRHRAHRHHAEGIFEAEREFGPTILNSRGRQVPTRLLGEQHVLEDLGRIPSLKDWLQHIQPQSWMLGKPKLVFRRSYTLVPDGDALVPVLNPTPSQPHGR